MRIICNIFLICILGISCKTYLSQKYGINENHPSTIMQLDKLLLAEDNKILCQSRYVDKSFVDSVLKLYNNDTSKTKYIKQPLQVMYFKKDTMISYHVNCNAGGFPLLKWNRNGNFDIFPPITQTVVSKTITKNFILNNTKQFNSNQIVKYDNKEYTVIVFWNYYLLKQSKNLIEIVQANLANQTNLNLLLVNNDLML